MAVKVEAARKSRETDIELSLGLDGGEISISTGVGFFDHMLTSLACHAGWSLVLKCRGDLDVDDHHTVEDCGIVLGAALAKAIEARGSIRRFGSGFAPLDEALARAVVDISGRPFCEASPGFARERIGSLATENIGHFFESLAMNAGITLHVDVLKGQNDHHRAEAAFKALALAMREALASQDKPAARGEVASNRAIGTVPGAVSTKGRPEMRVQVLDGKEEAR